MGQRRRSFPHSCVDPETQDKKKNDPVDSFFCIENVKVVSYLNLSENNCMSKGRRIVRNRMTRLLLPVPPFRRMVNRKAHFFVAAVGVVGYRKFFFFL